MTTPYIPDEGKFGSEALLIAHACAYVGGRAQIELGYASVLGTRKQLQQGLDEIWLNLVEAVHTYLTSADLSSPESKAKLEGLRFSHPDLWASAQKAEAELVTNIKRQREYLRHLRRERLQLVPKDEESPK